MKVLIVLGSKSDIEVTKGCGELLDKFQIPYQQEISSAHRQPEKTRKIVEKAEEKGVEVIIAAAGHDHSACHRRAPAGIGFIGSRFPVFHSTDARRYPGGLHGCGFPRRQKRGDIGGGNSRPKR
jgi:hypothetical protein